MKRFTRPIGIIALVILAAVGGYFLGENRGRGLALVAANDAPAGHHLPIDVDEGQPIASTQLDDNAPVDQKLNNGTSLGEIVDIARQRLSGGMINVGGIVEVFESMGAIDPAQMPELMRLIDASPNFQQKNLLYMAALTRWANVDGAGAADFAKAHFDSERAAGMLGAVFSSWASEQPLTAWAWFDVNRADFTNPAHEHQLLRNLYSGLSTRDFPAALARLSRETDFDLKTIGLQALGAASVATGSSDAFFEYARGIENQEQRIGAISSVVGQMAHVDPEGASVLVESLEPGRERAEAAKQVANAWFETDPDGSSKWYLTQVPDEGMPGAIRDVTNRLLRRDPNSAGEFLSQFEPGEQSDPARTNFSQSIAAIDPNSAITWARTITNDALRNGSLVNIYKQWHRREPQAAEASLIDSGLSGEQMQKVLER